MGQDHVTDPVCGMLIDPQYAKGKSDYHGETFYFCRPECKQAFDSEPTAYVTDPNDAPAEVELAPKNEAIRSTYDPS